MCGMLGSVSAIFTGLTVPCSLAEAARARCCAASLDCYLSVVCAYPLFAPRPTRHGQGFCLVRVGNKPCFL